MRLADLDGQCFRAQPMPVAGMAELRTLKSFELLTHPGAVRLAIAPLHVRDHAFEGARYRIDPPAIIIAELDLFIARSVQHDLVRMGGQFGPGLGGREPVMLGNRINGLLEIRRLGLGPGRQRAFHQRELRVRHDEAFVKEQLDPQPIAFRAGPEGRVEREQTRLDLGDGEARHGACELL